MNGEDPCRHQDIPILRLPRFHTHTPLHLFLSVSQKPHWGGPWNNCCMPKGCCISRRHILKMSISWMRKQKSVLKPVTCSPTFSILLSEIRMSVHVCGNQQLNRHLTDSSWLFKFLRPKGPCQDNRGMKVLHVRGSPLKVFLFTPKQLPLVGNKGTCQVKATPTTMW